MLTKKSYPIEHTFYLSTYGENKVFFTLKGIDDKTAEIIGKGLLAGNEESERFYLSISKTTKTEYNSTVKTLSHITEEEKVLSCYFGKKAEENTKKEYIRSYNWIRTAQGHVFFTKVLKNAHTSEEKPL